MMKRGTKYRLLKIVARTIIGVLGGGSQMGVIVVALGDDQLLAKASGAVDARLMAVGDLRRGEEGKGITNQTESIGSSSTDRLSSSFDHRSSLTNPQ